MINNILKDLLGQNGSLYMVAGRDLVATKNSIMFNFSGCDKANKVVITINGNDLYDVEFWKLSKNNFYLVDKFNDIYNFGLIKLFEEFTQLRLRIWG